MTLKEELLALEERFWKGDSSFYERMLSEGSIMVFPEPVGVLNKDESIRSLEGVPRWTDVTFGDVRATALTEEVALLTYRARARRGPDDPEYTALASSVYVNASPDALWKLAFHQQTPGAGA